MCANAAACAAPNVPVLGLVPAITLAGECSDDVGSGGSAPVGGGEVGPDRDDDNFLDRMLALERVDSRDAGRSVRLLEPSDMDVPGS